jgi:outer membrane murein-binding lipoprotein Lpp
MKKLFVFAVAAGMFFVACNGGSTPSADSTATTTVDTMNAAPTAAPVDSAAHVDSSAAAHVDSAAAATPAK